MKLTHRITRFACIICFFGLFASGFASSNDGHEINLTFDDVPLRTALDSVSQQTQSDIVYSDEMVESVTVTCDLHKVSLEQALKYLLRDTSLTFKMFDDDRIVLLWRKASKNKRFTLRGRVINAETGQPLPHVNVFLANTMMGAATNNNGEFHIYHVPIGTFDLVASMMGFEAEKIRLLVSGPIKEPLNFELTPKPLQAPQISVSATRLKEWRKDLVKFEELFFSATYNASRCKILNPYVLDFSRKEHGLFTSVAHDPLTIENRALGYKLHYVLEHFDASRHLITMRGYSRFEELEPRSPGEEREWRKNRLKAYHGSLKHFLATLCKSQVAYGEIDRGYLSQEGFEAYLIKHKDRFRRQEKVPVPQARDILLPAEGSDKLILSFPNYMLIEYNKERADLAYLTKYGMTRRQNSVIALTVDSVLVDTAGNLYDNNGIRVDGCGIRTSGYWSWERMADRLPWDYTASTAENDAQALSTNGSN
ncbi:hypothetical protein GWN42_21915 [candidate division KSB1 bacterium]|nr:hypothetical protein [candidate division KSB1 bacterium]